MVRIVPVPGRWLPGFPAAPADVDEAKAAALVSTGAFEYAEPPPEPAAEDQADPDEEM